MLLRALCLWVSFWPFFGRLFPEVNKVRATPQEKPETRSPSLSPHLPLWACERSLHFPHMKDSRFYSHSRGKARLAP